MDKLSEQLKADHVSGDSGQALEGYWQIAKSLEDKVKSLQDDLNKADELHFEECAELQKKIVMLKRELLIKNRN